MHRLLVLLVVAGACVLGRSPAPAGACTCAEEGVAAQRAEADVVLVGEVVEQEPSGIDEIHDAVRNTVEVERVYDGEAAAEVEVLGGESSSGACEYGFDTGRYLIFAVEDAAGLHTDLCSGTRPLAEGDPVPAELGRGDEPAALPPDPGDEPPIGGPEGDVEDPSWADRLLPEAAVGGVVVLAGAAAVALVLRSRRSTAGG